MSTAFKAFDRTESTPPEPAIFHELANLFPMMDGNAYRELVDDIAVNGVREPIVFLDSHILDGRNRYMAAREVGIEYPRVEFVGDDPLAFVISANLKRRHLTESQRAMVAAKLAKLPKGANQHAQICAPSQSEAAEMLNVSRRAVQTARQVDEAGTPELVKAVESGKASLNAAAIIAKQDHETQQRIIAEDNLKRAASDLRNAERQVREADALPKAKPLTDEEKAEQVEVFGTPESRAVLIDALNISERVSAFPDPVEAYHSIPPVLQHSFDLDAFREVARWFDAFCNAYEDEKETASVAAQ